MFLTASTEKQFIKKGYRISKDFNFDSTEAKNHAKYLRELGYYAFVGEYSTMIAGLHCYVVWAKKKEKNA